MEFHDIILYGQLDDVKQLLANGANVNYVDKYGSTLCYIASCHGKTSILKLLIANGADVNISNCDGNTPCHAASPWYLDILKILVSHGAVWDIMNKDGKTPLDLALPWGRTDTVEYFDILTKVRSVVCYLIGIRKGRAAPLKPLPKEGMGVLQHVPKEIVLMIARWVWVTRNDDEWLPKKLHFKK
jgi:ankyrin repeat protein